MKESPSSPGRIDAQRSRSSGNEESIAAQKVLRIDVQRSRSSRNMYLDGLLADAII